MISGFYDDFDAYAVLKIVKPDGAVSYFYQDEYVGIVFGERGEYTVTAYDRNNNTVTAAVTVE